MDPRSLQVGVNLGGWLSQYQAYDLAHFDSFIHADDIRRIADWGCDHVRLPVDYPVFEEEAHPGTINQQGIAYIFKALEWCNENHLNVILDLHKAPGFVFDNYQAATLFDDVSLQERFLKIWQMMAENFGGTIGHVAFELLNEIVLPEISPWNSLVRKTIEIIRAKDKDRLIIFGGNYYNSANQLSFLDIYDDPAIQYTFHFYEPLVVTHQKAPWVKALVDYNEETDYPGADTGLAEFLSIHPEHDVFLHRYLGKSFNKQSLELELQPAVKFSRIHGKSVYCGEFGVIERAPARVRLNWTRDVIAILRENNIGRAYWSYKGMDFGLIDNRGKVVDKELVKVVCQR